MNNIEKFNPVKGAVFCLLDGQDVFSLEDFQIITEDKENPNNVIIVLISNIGSSKYENSHAKLNLKHPNESWMFSVSKQFLKDCAFQIKEIKPWHKLAINPPVI
ncbi:MAG: hypothetical protein COV57_02115 [Candidatus Liptonbacteria bacterium CG11_big_fil_rev_8_21_14_0_20_35_14]|uniref:Uncharacterized protein n=1 Tax=Candidatus Liptonbacteria bacterium CG11_big_fil_rev_8_21_14_0_20_35_14 TaxID=1974634 RepID=A0A2H0N7J8_9BACT|nr:MAG: hypothetical protein COV57_02115 [Candidatus Liptonbacteria bacterium CG11_big_fil_rev_8_21_14_0_20_35_14]